ncbi:hypothetical protein [Edaphobacillus lindanitolerans]|uniref:hypothetical protein n=1 Tax=Edaphobacillus lindanitolerans TaxID=550447 RepID=UPI00118623D8|nr:hypothetical protein [Edaphobacillus lindanitolerans]
MTNLNKLRFLGFAGGTQLLMVVLFIVVLCTAHLIRVFRMAPKVNGFDFFYELFNLHAVTYTIIPLFLIWLASFFSFSHVRQYTVFRYRSRFRWILAEVTGVYLMASSFILVIFFIGLLQALFSMGFEGGWSEGFRSNFSFAAAFLDKNSPYLFTIASMILVFLLLFSYGMMYLFIWILTKNAILPAVLLFVVDIFNLIVSLGKVEPFTDFLFTKHFDIMQGIQSSGAIAVSIPYYMFTYWLVLILALLILSGWAAKKTDLQFIKEGSRDD